MPASAVAAVGVKSIAVAPVSVVATGVHFAALTEPMRKLSIAIGYFWRDLPAASQVNV